MNTTIEVSHLRKKYATVEALKGVSWQIGQGQIFGLLGANGAGKTTMMRILVGSTRQSSGEVSVLGLKPYTQAHLLRPQIGYMPQAPALYEDLSAHANLRFFARAHSVPNLEKRIDEILEFVDLVERQNHPVYGFSGGMKQRVSLACTLIHQPRILFLDEPTAGVDPKLRETFWERFRQLASEGVTIIVSTHQMDEALHCDQLAIMRNGEILVCDTPLHIMEIGQTTVKIWQDSNSMTTEILTHYPKELPLLMQKYPSMSRIEIEADTLETIVLRLIKSGARQDA